MLIEESGIYQIRNLTNNKIYIGSTINFRKRKNRHFSLLSLDKHYNNHLQRAFNIVGKENFVFEILIICYPDMLEWYEQQFVDQWKPEYNQRNLVNSNLGIKRSKEYKKNVGNFFRGKSITEEHKKNISFANRYKKSHRNKTGYKGVSLLPNNKYRAVIFMNGKPNHLGVFPTATDAYNAYTSKAMELKGGY